MTSSKQVTFKKLEIGDLDLLEKWNREPHVKKYWDSDKSWEESYEKYILRTSSEVVKQFIAYDEETPFAYIQFYWASKVGDGWWEGIDEGTAGIDLYIGEPSYLGKGFGKTVLKSFVDFLFDNPEVNRIIADPNPKNEKIQKLLMSLGFSNIGPIKTPDGEALLFELRRSRK